MKKMVVLIIVVLFLLTAVTASANHGDWDTTVIMQPSYIFHYDVYCLNGGQLAFFYAPGSTTQGELYCLPSQPLGR